MPPTLPTTCKLPGVTVTVMLPRVPVDLLQVDVPAKWVLVLDTLPQLGARHFLQLAGDTSVGTQPVTCRQQQGPYHHGEPSSLALTGLQRSISRC